ncbi:MAG: hypothetical protein ACOCVZ_01415 [Gemmatimonadota bacterium]
MRSTAVISLAALAAASGATAQQLVGTTHPLRTAPLEIRSVEVAPRTAPPPVPPALAEESAPEEERGSLWSDVAHAVGGGLVGGWVGYVGAQLTRSDWDKEHNGDFRGQRMTWAAAGVLAGVVGSQVLIRDTRPPIEGPRGAADRRLPGTHITAEEIREASVNNAYELIYYLHREWLIPRGTHSFTESAVGRADSSGVRVVSGQPKIKVYVNDIRLGGPEAMYQIPADWLTGAEFLDSREATYRYGIGHTHGAIRLSTLVASPDGAESP